MKLLKLLPILVLVCCMVGCNPPAGELVGAVKDSQFQEAHPYGMVFIRKGSFLMGPNSQSAVFSQDDNNIMATVHAFWMDESEITNNEYRQFVNWVRDSIAYRYLIEEMGEDSEYALQSEYEVDEDVLPRINWKSKIPWENRFVPDDPIAEALAPMFYAEGRGALRTTMLHYDYSWMNIDEVKKNANRFDITTGTYPEGATVRVDTFWVENGAILSKTIERPLREPKDAVTNIRVIERYNDATLIECILETGRTHQIRVHMEYIKHPVVNDPVYGYNRMDDKDFGQMLHAKEIGFIHPVSREFMDFKVDAPSKFWEILEIYKNK